MTNRHRTPRLTIAAAALIAAVTIPMSAGAAAPTQPGSSVGVATNVPLTSDVASASFVDQHGHVVTLGSLRGKTVFLVPYLTLCGDTCPFTTGNLLQLQNKLNTDKAKNVVVIGISVDPYRDTPARIKAYSSLVGASFGLWTERGVTTTPNATQGAGDTNANLTAIEQFFGWDIHVIEQGSPAPKDWMSPYHRLTYDIDHSDGFWVIDARQNVRFESGNLPAYSGTLAKKLATFMGQSSNIYKGVNPGGWTPTQALQTISWVTGVTYR